jgi:M6 family metalloprotease-like protein
LGQLKFLMMKRFSFFLFLICLAYISTAVPYLGLRQWFRQPDGKQVELLLFGDEFYMRAETVDGFTVTREPESKWICYARLSIDGRQLVSTGIRVTEIPLSESQIRRFDLKSHLDISAEARKEVVQENALRLAGGYKASLELPGHPHVHGTPVVPVSGNLMGLTLLVDFPDQPSTLPVSEFEAFCNQLDYSNFSNNGSLRTYFRDVSAGKLDYQNRVFGFYRAPQNFTYYDSLPYAQGAQILLGEALQWLENQGFDFSTLSLNEDNTIQAINLMYTGEPPVWAQGMWHHKGYYSQFESASGIRSGDYNCSPANSPLGIGVVAHENGHMIGKWPDTYKYTNTNGPDGIGAFDLMCWYGSTSNPVPPNPLFRLNAGWGKRVDVSNKNGQIRDTANSLTVYQYDNPSDSTEFYLLEARARTGRSAVLPDAGLTIWHIDRKGNNQSRHHEVKLVPANADTTDQSAACFRASFRPKFDQTTNPKSEWYNRDPSGLKVSSISARAPIMTYNLGSGVPGASLKLKFAGIAQEQNPNGFPEPGESFETLWEVVNRGELASASINAQLSVAGNNAGWISLSGTTQSPGILSVNQSDTLRFPMQLLSDALVGEAFWLRLLVNDGTASATLTQKFNIGVRHVMQQGEETTCQTLFTDPGGDYDYDNYLDLYETFYPLTQSAKIKARFLEFALEDHSNCAYDYLRVHNGPSPTSSQMGKWCGTSYPDSLVSSHSTGALTFVFHSDEGVAASGWKIRLECKSLVANEEIQSLGFIQVFPNPGKERLVVSGVADFHWQLLSVEGKEIRTGKGRGGESLVLPGLPSGFYLLQVQTENGSRVLPWIKQ